METTTIPSANVQEIPLSYTTIVTATRRPTARDMMGQEDGATQRAIVTVEIRDILTSIHATDGLIKLAISLADENRII